MARQDVLNRLKELGWDGPTSYTLPYLNEMITTLESGTTVDQLKETRKKTSSAEVKGNGRAPKGEWIWDGSGPVTVPQDVFNDETPEWVDGDGVRWRKGVFDVEQGVQRYEKFAPAVKQPKVKAEKGAWVVCGAPSLPEENQPPLPGIVYEVDSVRYRMSVVMDEDTQQPTFAWDKFVPTPKKVAKLKGNQQANFDPREMLRVFENDDMRVRTGGRDWTMVPVEFLEEQLTTAQRRGEAAVLVDIDGSKEACDVVWLEALVAVKKRLALREEVVGDGDSSAPTD